MQEAVAIIPFLNQTLVQCAIASIPLTSLSKREHTRNTHGQDLIVSYSPEIHARVPAPCSSLPPLDASHTIITPISLPDFPPNEPRFVPRLCKGVRVGTSAPPGFPTVFSLPLQKTALEAVGVDLFGRASRRESMVLTLADSVNVDAHLAAMNGHAMRIGRLNSGGDALAGEGKFSPREKKSLAGEMKAVGGEELANALFGRDVWCGWPYWNMGRIVSLCDGTVSVTASQTSGNMHQVG